MTETPLSALVAAWTTTMIAATLFLTVLALARIWDGTVYFQALQSVLNLDM